MKSIMEALRRFSRLVPVCEIFAFADRYRYVLALIVLAVTVLFNLNGSSLGMWHRHVSNDHAEAPLWGIPREVRSDEWGVFTPLTLAQAAAGEDAYAYFSTIPRGTKTDMFATYAQPVKHPLLVFRPFLAGFVFLGFERGLAFFWAARWLALFLAMYALFKRLTSDDRLLSAIGATMVVLAPVVQWWGAINALAEMLIFGALGILALDRFLTETSWRRRILPAAGLAYCAVAYAMTLYPAAMVPLGYVFAAVTAGVIVQRARGFRFDTRTCLVVLAVGVVAVAALAFYVWTSREAFRLTAGTVYPGARIGTGGGCWQNLTNAWGNLFLPWTLRHLVGNAFERSAFLDFFPLGAVLAVYACIMRRRLDAIAAGLLVVSAVLFVYCVIGIPEPLAKATLLGRSTGERASVAFGFAQVLLLFRSLALLKERRFRWWESGLIALAFCAFSVLMARRAYGCAYLTDVRCVAVAWAAFLGCFLFLSFRSWRVVAAVFFAGLMAFAGARVNPVQRGSAGVLDSDLARAIRDIARRDKGLWLVEGRGFPITNFPIMFGAPTINATNTYPVTERWEMFDPDHADEQVWNRYAHIQATIVPQVAKRFTLLQGDYFAVELDNADVVRLGVKYVLSPRDLTALSDGRVAYRPIGSASGYTIYEVLSP